DTWGSVGGSGVDVNMSVEPQVTSEDSILLSVDIDINDQGMMDAGFASSLWNDFDGYNRSSTVGISMPSKNIQTEARVNSGGTIVLGGWTGEMQQDLSGGVPGLRNLPWVGKLFFSHSVQTSTRTNMLIFLSAQITE
ncbi:MAG: hypothetical protein ACOC2L_03815, partial [Candidatus Sumerlaeota bacterium]